MVKLSQNQRAVMAHVVVDPDAWLANVVAVMGEAKAAAALANKVSRWEPEYLKAKTDEGEMYQTRAEREVL